MSSSIAVRNELSGGELARAKLAALIVDPDDVVLLDEPTNDLDFDGLEVLERFVAETPSALVVVSHDRAFLENTVERIVEFEAETRTVREFGGSWAEYERLARPGQRSARRRPTRSTSESAIASAACSTTVGHRRGRPARWPTAAGRMR